MKPANITDALKQGRAGLEGQGTVAQRLLQSGFKASALRTNDVLQKDEWVQFDAAVVEVARQRLIGVADLLNAGLRYNLSNALGTTVVQWETVSDMTAAEISMSGVTDGRNDRVDFALKSLPVPIVHKDFNINIRALEASRRMGESLDTTQAALCGKLVAERNEEILFNGATLVGGGGSVTGYTTAANRNTGNLTANWALAGTSGATIFADVLAMVSALKGDHMYGPYVLYVPQDYYTKLSEDYKAESDRTILERILAIPGLTAVRPSDNLQGGGSGSDVVLVQMTRDVIDMVVGMQPTTLMWDGHGGMISYFKVMSIMVPRIKSDFTNQSGIAHYSVA